MMDRTRILFTAVMLGLVVAMAGWMAVGIWPKDWLKWRAERGEQRAVGEMYKRAILDDRGEHAAYWGNRLKKISTNDLVFMSAHDRKIFRLLGEAQGISYTSPILDLIDKH